MLKKNIQFQKPILNWIFMPSSAKRCQISRDAPQHETYLAQIYIHKTEATGNDARQNALATWIEVKTLYRQQNSHIQSNIKPIWTYGIQLWGMASTSNIEILERFQSQVLSTTADAPWYMPNTGIQRDLQTPTVKEKIHHYSSQYNARLSVHPNNLVVNLMTQPNNRRLRGHMPNNLPTTF
jgi:hypothetical protein